MEIKHIQYKQFKKIVRYSASVQFRNDSKEEVFFEVEKKYEDFIMPDASALFAAFLLPAMKNDEDIQIDGTVSTQLFGNTEKIHRLFQSWKMKWHKPEIKTFRRKDNFAKPKYTACFFSGGVDSFYTLLKNQNGNKDKITHFIFVHGFDIDLKNKALFTVASENVRNIAKEMGIELIIVRTNIKDVLEKYLVWDFAHGGALGSVALLLRKKINTCYIAGALAWDGLFPYGTHPALDPLWGSEKLQIVHDGNERTRVQKLKDVVGKSILAQKYLRVCNQNIKGIYNCCSCFKCVRTMCEIVAANALPKFKTFPKKLDLDKVRQLYFDYKANYNLLGEEVVKILLSEKRDLDVAEALLYTLEKSKHPTLKQRVVKYVAHFDQTYNKRRIYRSVFALNKNHDRRTVFKFLGKIGVIK